MIDTIILLYLTGVTAYEYVADVQASRLAVCLSAAADLTKAPPPLGNSAYAVV